MRMKSLLFFVSTIVIVNFSVAQVSVKDEPRHHNLFENNYVRILDVHLKPGDTTSYHMHATPSVFIRFSKTKTIAKVVNQPASISVSQPGTVVYDNYAIPITHQVWNDDTSWFHVMDVEILHKPKTEKSTANIRNAQVLFKEPLVNGYKLQLSSEMNFSIKKLNTPLLLVSIGVVKLSITIDGKEQIRVMNAGHFIWIQPNENVVIKALNNTQGSFALLEFN